MKWTPCDLKGGPYSRTAKEGAEVLTNDLDGAPQILEFGERKGFVYVRVSPAHAMKPVYRYSQELSPAEHRPEMAVIHS